MKINNFGHPIIPPNSDDASQQTGSASDASSAQDKDTIETGASKGEFSQPITEASPSVISPAIIDLFGKAAGGDVNALNQIRNELGLPNLTSEEVQQIQNAGGPPLIDIQRQAAQLGIPVEQSDGYIARLEKANQDMVKAAGGDLNAYQSFISAMQGRQLTDAEKQAFQESGGPPLLGIERQSQLSGIDFSSQALNQRINKANQDSLKGLGGDLQAYINAQKAMTGSGPDIFEQWEFESGGGPNVIGVERQLELMGQQAPQQWLDRLNGLAKAVDAAKNGDPQALSTLEAAFGAMPGSLSAKDFEPTQDGSRNAGDLITGLLQSGLQRNDGSSNSKSGSDTGIVTGLFSSHGDYGTPTDTAGSAGDTGSESPDGLPDPGVSPDDGSAGATPADENQPASDPSEWQPYPGSSTDAGSAAVGINGVDVREDGTVQILLSNGTSQEFSSVNEAMEWEKQQGYGAAQPDSSGASDTGASADDGDTHTTIEGSTSVEVEAPSEDDNHPENTDDQPSSNDGYIDPDGVYYDSGQLTEQGALKLAGGGVTDGVNPDLDIQDAPPVFVSHDPYGGVTDPTPEGGEGSPAGFTSTTPDFNRMGPGPDTRPDLESEPPDGSPNQPGIDPYANKG